MKTCHPLFGGYSTYGGYETWWGYLYHPNWGLPYVYPQFAQGMTLRSRDEVENSWNFRCPASPGTANGKRWINLSSSIKKCRKNIDFHMFPPIPQKFPNGIYVHLHDSNKTSRLQPLTPWNFWVSAHTSPPFPKSPGTTGASFEGSMASCSAIEFNAIHRFGRERAETRRFTRGVVGFFGCWWLHHPMIPNMLWSSKNGSLNTPNNTSHALEKSILQETSTTLHFPAPLQNLPDLWMLEPWIGDMIRLLGAPSKDLIGPSRPLCKAPYLGMVQNHSKPGSTGESQNSW